MIVLLAVSMALLVIVGAGAGALALLLRDARTQLGRERQSHAAEIERINTLHVQMTDRILHMQQYGTPTPKEAVVADREPDAESRVLRQISEDSVKAGSIALKQMYEDAGVMVSEEEVREEAISMLMGIAPSPHPSRALLVKD